MNRFLFWATLLNLTVLNSDASTTQLEKKLLASWGVEQEKTGLIKYKNKQPNLSTYWVNKPVSAPTHIDYSVIPVRLKPLVIYNN